MEVMEFSNETKVDHIPAPWEKYMGEADFVSYMPSYEGGQYIEQFAEHKYMTDDKGEITYYLYTPDKTQYEPGKKFKLIMFIHGATNALAGKVCVSHSGGEMFADPQRQAKMEGAYILVPLANERMDENGQLADSWDEKYVPHLKGIIDEVMKSAGDIDTLIVGGGSSGGYMTWEMLKGYPELFAGAFPVSGFADDYIECLKSNTKLLIACSRHDEFGVFDRITEDEVKTMEAAPNAICYFPELLRNGDHGVASLNFGIEMGQHCMITQIQADLIYTDGKPYLDELPEGMTGWFRDIGR